MLRMVLCWKKNGRWMELKSIMVKAVSSYNTQNLNKLVQMQLKALYEKLCEGGRNYFRCPLVPGLLQVLFLLRLGRRRPEEYRQ